MVSSRVRAKLCLAAVSSNPSLSPLTPSCRQGRMYIVLKGVAMERLASKLLTVNDSWGAIDAVCGPAKIVLSRAIEKVEALTFLQLFYIDSVAAQGLKPNWPRISRTPVAPCAHLRSLALSCALLRLLRLLRLAICHSALLPAASTLTTEVVQRSTPPHVWTGLDQGYCSPRARAERCLPQDARLGIPKTPWPDGEAGGGDRAHAWR